METYVISPKSELVELADLVREITGTTGPMNFSEVKNAVAQSSPSFEEKDPTVGPAIEQHDVSENSHADLRSDIETLKQLTAMSNDEIDAICGASIIAADVVTYSGSGTLSTNTVYTMDVSEQFEFFLPSSVDISTENHIRVMATVTEGADIKWGTTIFYGGSEPYVTAGIWEFVFDYNPVINAWVAGAVCIG